MDAAGVVVGTVEVEEAVGSTAGGSLAAVQQHTAVVAVQQEDTDTAPVSCRSGSHRAAAEVLTSSPETLPTQITIYTRCVAGAPKDLIKKSLGTPVVVCNVWLGSRRGISGRENLRSAERHDMLLVPSTRTQLGRRSFHVAAQAVSNALPPIIIH